MAEGVIAGPAVVGAGHAVVVLVADYVVGVVELALAVQVLAPGPLTPQGQVAAGRRPADEVVLVFWMTTIYNVLTCSCVYVHAKPRLSRFQRFYR